MSILRLQGEFLREIIVNRLPFMILSSNLLHSYWIWPFIVSFVHWKWWFWIVMLVHQRVNDKWSGFPAIFSSDQSNESKRVQIIYEIAGAWVPLVPSKPHVSSSYRFVFFKTKCSQLGCLRLRSLYYQTMWWQSGGIISHFSRTPNWIWEQTNSMLYAFMLVYVHIYYSSHSDKPP